LLVTFCDSRQPDQLVWGFGIDPRRWQEEGWKTKEDMTRHAERKFGDDGCGLE